MLAMATLTEDIKYGEQINLNNWKMDVEYTRI